MAQEAEIMPPDKIVTERRILSQRSVETTLEEIKELRLVERLGAMFDKGWVQSLGWAAIQIGIPLRCAVYRDKMQVVLLNPVVKEAHGLSLLKQREGCKSLPYQRFLVYRYSNITIENGPADKRYEINAVGREAQIIQHELDHMDGILCDARGKIQDRNAPCACGSGTKFKKCCGK